MVKKIKRPPRSGHKDKRGSTLADKNSSEKTEIVKDNVVRKERKGCPHFDKGIDLATVTSKVSSAEDISCEDCKEENKGKAKIKVESSKSESKAVWVCLRCGHLFCGGIEFPTIPQSHAVRHVNQTRHYLAIQYDDPRICWCFLCGTLIPVEKIGESGEFNDSLSEIVKLIKGRSTKKVSVIIEDVLSKIKSENTRLYGISSYLVRGLVNLGNTCFFNSIMQNLLALDRLRAHYLELNESLGPLTMSLKKIFIETVSDFGLRNLVNPRSFFDCLCAKAPQFRGYQQHDSHELLRWLLDGLCTEELSAKKYKKSGTFSLQGPTFVDAIFGGQLESTISCLDCGHSSKVFEPFLDLSLPVPTKKTLSKMLNQPISLAKKQNLSPKRNGQYNPSAYSSVQEPLVNGDASFPLACTEPVLKEADDAVSAGSSNQMTTEMIEKHRFPKKVTDDSSWLDNLKPVTMSNNNGRTSKCDDIAASHDAGEKDHGQLYDSPVQDSVASSGQALIFIVTTIGSSENLSSLEFVEQTQLVDDHNMRHCMGPETENTSSPNQKVSEEIEKKSFLGNVTDDSSWLNNLEPVIVSNENDATPECDIAASHNAREKDQGQLNKSVQDGIESVESTNHVLNCTVTTTGSSENLSWVDFVEPSHGVYGHDMVSEFDDGLVNLDIGVAINQSVSNSHSIGAESNCSPVYSFENEQPLHAQSSEVILLPYKEEGCFNGEGLTGKEEVYSSAIGCEPDSLRFNGFGHFLNEPNLVEGPIAKPMSCSVHRNSSESDPDKVDNSNFPVSVESCLKYFTKPELLSASEHGWICENCSKSLQEQKRQPDKKHQRDAYKIEQIGFEDRVDDSLCTREVRNTSNREITKGIDSFKFDDDDATSEKIDPIFEASNFQENNARLTQFPSEANVNCISSYVCNANGSAQAEVHQNEVQISAQGSESEVKGDEEMNSESIKVKRDATKRILINKAPSILTIHLKRFSQDARGRLSKLNGHVDFKDSIDLRQYMDSQCNDMEEFKYRLSGVVEHSGTMRRGHYVAYVRGSKMSHNGDNSVWYHASDASVRQVSFQEVLQCEAYILFYEKI